MNGGNGKCSGDKDACDGNEHCNMNGSCSGNNMGNCQMDKDHCQMGGNMGNCPMDKGQCQMGSGNMGGCPMDKGKCGMDSGMSGKCNMDKGMDGKCNMGGMQMHGCCCCCCCMMMMNGMHCNMNDGDDKVDSPKVKVRGKL
jgi:hypothetical protein